MFLWISGNAIKYLRIISPLYLTATVAKCFLGIDFPYASMLFTNLCILTSHTDVFCSQPFVAKDISLSLSLSLSVHFHCPRKAITSACLSSSAFIESVSLNLIWMLRVMRGQLEIPHYRAAACLIGLKNTKSELTYMMFKLHCSAAGLRTVRHNITQSYLRRLDL